MGELIARALKRHPERVAFRMGERSVLYREAETAIARLLGLFEALGLKRGDTLVQIARNSPEQWFAIAACYLYGLRSVALQASVADDEHRVRALRDCGATLVVCDPEEVRAVALLRERAPGVRLWFCHGAEAAGVPDLWAAAAEPAPLANRAEPEDIVRIGYTSGTTGAPKGVLLSSRALAACAELNLIDDPWPREAVVLCSEALAGGFGNYVVPTLVSGGTVVLTRAPSAEAFLEAAARWRPTIFLCLPPLLRALLDHPKTRAVDWSRLELIIFSGASLTRTEAARSREIFGPALTQVYGQTECPKGLAILRRADHSDDDVKLASVGTPFSGVQLAVLRENLTECQPGEMGEICVRGPITMSGYLNLPDRTAETLRGGWLHTGDLAFADERGFLFLVDRAEERVRHGDETIVPRFVEDALTAHPQVATAAVVGLGRVSGRAELIAYVIARPGPKPSAQALRAFLAEKGTAVPDAVSFLEEMPLTTVGRTDKGRLRRLAQEARTVVTTTLGTPAP